MSGKRSNPDFLNGVPELLVLQLLSRRAMYGYELVQEIKSASGAELQFGEGCIYPILHKLEKEGVLAAKRESAGGRNRVVYRVTRRGEKRLAGSAANWGRIAAAVSRILSPGEQKHAAVA